MSSERQQRSGAKADNIYCRVERQFKTCGKDFCGVEPDKEANRVADGEFQAGAVGQGHADTHFIILDDENFAHRM